MQALDLLAERLSNSYLFLELGSDQEKQISKKKIVKRPVCDKQLLLQVEIRVIWCFRHLLRMLLLRGTSEKADWAEIPG